MDDRSPPTSGDLMYPTLDALRALGGESHRDDVRESVVASLAATVDIHSAEHGLSVREAVFRRVGFSLSKLKKVGAVESSGWGRWRVTDEGLAYLDRPDGDEALRHREHELRVGQRPEQFFERVRTESGARGLEISVRELLAEWDVKRRGSEVVTRIQRDLAANGITTLPRFDQVAIDDTILVRADTTAPVPEPAHEMEEPSDSPNQVSGHVPDKPRVPSGTPELPSITAPPGQYDQDQGEKFEIAVPDPAVADFERPFEVTIGTLPSAGSGLRIIPPELALTDAIGIMESNGYSQLAVGSDRQLKGSISWADVGREYAYGGSPLQVKDVMNNDPVAVRFDDPLLRHVRTIADRGFIFVRDEKQVLSGIVTSSDLSVRFEELAKPFLLIGHVEGWLRAALDSAFSSDELAAAIDGDQDDREVEGAKDLTFGEFARLLENPHNWEKLGWSVPRVEFCKHLHAVRQIRNEVMHFSPEPISEVQIDQIQRLLDWIQRLATRGQTGK